MFGTLDIGLSAFRRIIDLWRGAKADSLIDYTKTLRVEPLTVLDAEMVHNEATPEIMQSLQSIFSGYYLQAVAVSTTVGKIEVMRHLDKLNPNRDATDSALDTTGWLLAAEAYKDRLPLPRNGNVAMESVGEMLLGREDDDERDYAAVMARDTTKELRELSNLSVGKMLAVEITDGLHRASIPVNIRLIASSMPSSNLAHILSAGNEDTSVKERYHGWRSGRKEFIRDLCLCQDIIDAHRKNLMQDKSGVYAEILKRLRSNQLSGIVSGNPSVANASNLVVMSANTAAEVELKINGRLDNFKTRQKIFEAGYWMIMVVYNPQTARATFYHRGIPMATDVSLRDMKVSNKGNGPDVSEILRAYQMGSSPTL